MPRIMYKPRPDRGEYVIWSTVSDIPVSGAMDRGTAKEAWRAGSCSILGAPISAEQAEESMARADTKGWSLIDGEPGEYALLHLANVWDYSGPYQSGVCRVEDLAAVARAIEARDWAALHSLLTELMEWEDEDA